MGVRPVHISPGGAQGRSVEARLDADFAGAHVTAVEAELPHAGQGELAQVALLDAAGDEGHGDVALDAVHAHPRRHQCQQPRHLPPTHGSVRASRPLHLQAPCGAGCVLSEHGVFVRLEPATAASGWGLDQHTARPDKGPDHHNIMSHSCSDTCLKWTFAERGG